MNGLAFWVHNLDPIAIHLPAGLPLKGIYWYGLAYVTSLIMALLALKWYTRKGLLNLYGTEPSNCIFCLMIGILFGGRLGYYLLYEFEYFWQHPLQIIKIWEGGMSSHGGFIGAGIALIAFCRYNNKPLLKLADGVSTLVPIGFFLGRIANFINGELWGKPSQAPWAVIFPKSHPLGHLYPNLVAPRHPSQLYEALLEGLVLGVYLNYRFWKAKASERPLRTGQLTAEFFIGYAIARILAECFREPDASLISGLTRGQFYSVFLLLFGIGLWAVIKRTPLLKI